MKLEATSRLLATRTTPWFLVESLQGRRPNLWCRKRGSGRYDLFNASERGPYVTDLTDQWLKQNVRALRQPDGSLTVADADQQKFIQHKLNKYLELR